MSMERVAGGELQTPRAAAIAGILFALFLASALALVHVAVPAGGHPGAWTSDADARRTVSLALDLLPFAGIAFLWFIGVVRDRIGAREDRFFATVFLGSGLLFVAMLFVAAATAGGILAEAAAHPRSASSAAFVLNRRITSQLLNIYAMRMAGVFTIATATIAIRTEAMPRWIGIIGYASAVILLISLGISQWVELLFPAWILLVSIDTLVTSLRRPGAGAGDRAGGPRSS
jgi:hypothetical protein